MPLRWSWSVSVSFVVVSAMPALLVAVGTRLGDRWSVGARHGCAGRRGVGRDNDMAVASYDGRRSRDPTPRDEVEGGQDACRTAHGAHAKERRARLRLVRERR